jgi:hypothetical protein
MIEHTNSDLVVLIAYLSGNVAGLLGYHLMVRHHRLLARQAKRKHPSTQKAFLTIPLDEV